MKVEHDKHEFRAREEIREHRIKEEQLEREAREERRELRGGTLRLGRRESKPV